MKKYTCFFLLVVFIFTSCSSMDDTKIYNNGEKEIEMAEIQEKTTEEYIDQILNPLYINYPTEDIYIEGK